MKFLKYLVILALVFTMLQPVLNCSVALAAPSSSGIKGVNNPHIWWDSQSYSALDSIKNNGFNTVRVVWQTSGTGTRLKEIIDRCKTLGLKPIPELHDVTGGTSASQVDQMATYFINNKSYIASDVWINIANEWGPANSTTWRDAYKSAISRIRSAGMSNTIVVDSGGWGQNDQDILNYASEVLNSDPNKNVMFSIHMYGEWNDNSKIYSFLSTCKNNGIPIMVGEFGYNYNNGGNNLNCKVDAAYLMSTCNSLGIGYIAWSWCGNDSSNAWLDMTNNWGSLNTWGNMVKNGGSGGSTPTPTPTPGGSTSTPTPSGGTTVLANFENTTDSWIGSNQSAGPWSVTEWAYNGSYSLKADVALSSGKKIYLYKSGTTSFSGKSQLKAVVKHASWGTQGSGMIAKVYVKTGSGYTWYDSGSVSIGTGNTTITLNLSGVSNLGDVREYGVEYTCGSNSSSTSAIYVDYVTLQ